jgi:SAM-dependent methyltransferase
VTGGGDHSIDRSVDWDRAAAHYHQTRGASDAWREPVRAALATAPPGPVVDLGSGTGLWSGLLADWTGRPVLAVEPSAGMRAVALAGGTGGHHGTGEPDAGEHAGGHHGTGEPDAGEHAGGHHGTGAPAPAPEPGPAAAPGAGIQHLAGVGGALPLRGASAAGAWLSGVVHHVGDVGACARELRRVLLPGAPVVIRGAFAGRHRGIPLVRYFPGAIEALDRYPAVDDVIGAFGDAGFGFVLLDGVDEPSPGLAHWRDGLPRQRLSDTALVGLSDDEFAAGLRAVDADIAAGADPGPVRLDLLVLR